MSGSSRFRGIDVNQSVLINILCKQHQGLNVVHFNARSLNGSKLDYVKLLFESSLVDIICVSETWFSNDLPAELYKIKGYNLFCNNRLNKKGGGVAVFCKSSLNAKVVSQSDGTEVEYINVEVYDKCSRILVSCVYNPNRSCSPEPFFIDLSRRIIDYDFYLTCGDFNTNLLNNDQCCQSFRDHISSVGLAVVNNSLPTRFSPNSAPSLLDLFLISDLKRLFLFDQMSFISDHDLIN